MFMKCPAGKARMVRPDELVEILWYRRSGMRLTRNDRIGRRPQRVPKPAVLSFVYGTLLTDGSFRCLVHSDEKALQGIMGRADSACRVIVVCLGVGVAVGGCSARTQLFGSEIIIPPLSARGRSLSGMPGMHGASRAT